MTLNSATQEFSRLLLQWHASENHRQMPWKAEKDPYKIWLSEIILQQTRVNQGLSYYLHFIQQYPTLKDLAKAPDEQVFKSWEGLGYYSRCRNMLFTARFIAEKRNGIFPTTYPEILSLKGVGEYTAAAIASFAYNLPHAVVDGNVIRVLCRVFGINSNIATQQGKKQLASLAHQLLNKKHPAKYNQAIMDFGATVCLPRSPLCNKCPFQKSCVAYRQNKIEELPVKLQKAPRKKRYFNYVMATYRDKLYIRQRTEKDIWRHLHEFILCETPGPVFPDTILTSINLSELLGPNYRIIRISPPVQQTLTHQQIQAVFIRVELSKPLKNPEYTPVSKAELSRKAFPKLVRETGLQMLHPERIKIS